uniref:Peptidase A1 domain-containing protein n=1 Tax=Steinernema glaseri TaxID=37863 RepID=A0A1I8AEI5_9BILA
RFVVAADTFGHDMIIGSDLLHALGFQFYDESNKEFFPLPSLHTAVKCHTTKNPPIRILNTTRVRPKESKIVKVRFNGNVECPYLMEPAESLSDDIRIESALVDGAEGEVPWLVHNGSPFTIDLEDGAILGFASEVRHVVGEQSFVDDGPTIAINSCKQADDEGDLPFSLTLSTPTESDEKY